MSSFAHYEVRRDAQASLFEAYARQFLRSYPVLMSLCRDAQKYDCSRLLPLLDDGLVYTVYLEGTVKRPGEPYTTNWVEDGGPEDEEFVHIPDEYSYVHDEWNKWRVVINHDVCDTDADVALRWSIEHNHSQVVEYLVVALECAQYLVGAERHRRHPFDDETGKNILDFASQEGDMGLIRLLLALDNSKWMEQICRTPLGQTPLHWACMYGREDVVRFLIDECGAGVDVIGMFARTPLHYAAKGGHLAIVELLVMEFGADVHIKEGYPYPLRNTALHFAAEWNHISIVRFLVETCDADVDEKGYAGGTPLHMAARYGHREIVEYLVRECGADVESYERSSRKTAAEIAHSCGNFDILANFLCGEEERRCRKRAAKNATTESRLEGESMESNPSSK